jgi:hypothetical protein
MTQSFIILVTADETKLDVWEGRRIEAAIRELHEAANKPPTTCHIYPVENPATLTEWEKKLKKENAL